MRHNAVGLTLCRETFGRTYFTTQCLGFVLIHSAADAVATKKPLTPVPSQNLSSAQHGPFEVLAAGACCWRLMVIMSSAQTFALGVGRLSAAPCTAGVHFTCAAPFCASGTEFHAGRVFWHPHISYHYSVCSEIPTEQQKMG
jgi:hypothetical protein